MAIIEDFSINNVSRVVTHISGTTVYTVNQLYSFIQDTFDEISNMSFTVPMSAQTPTEYTLINSWFIPNDTFKYLKGGAIQTSGWDANTNSNGIYVFRHTVSGYVNCVPSDVGSVVSDGTHTGILLDYDNTLRKWWVRRVDGTAWMGNAYVVSGTGSGILDSVTTGENTYSNIYTLGLLDPSVTNMLYIEQINPELTNNQIAGYWPDGHIDLLIQVKECGTYINSGNLTVFCREYGNLYSHFTANVSAGGRNPIPLSTSVDDNHKTPKSVVQTWDDVTITFGNVYRDLGDGRGMKEYDIVVDCGLRNNINEVYERLQYVTMRDSGVSLYGALGQFFTSDDVADAVNTFAPFGSYAGGKFFGRQGLFLTNIPANDINNVELTESLGTKGSYPFTAAGSLVFNPILQNDINAKYTMFFTTNPAGNYGTIDAVIVKDSFGNPITGKINGRSSVGWTFDYSFNNQGGRTANTDANVTIFVMGIASGYYNVVNTTITKAIDQNLSVSVTQENNYAN